MQSLRGSVRWGWSKCSNGSLKKVILDPKELQPNLCWAQARNQRDCTPRYLYGGISSQLKPRGITNGSHPFISPGIDSNSKGDHPMICSYFPFSPLVSPLITVFSSDLVPGPAATEVQLLGAAGNQRHGDSTDAKIVGCYLGTKKTLGDRSTFLMRNSEQVTLQHVFVPFERQFKKGNGASQGIGIPDTFSSWVVTCMDLTLKFPEMNLRVDNVVRWGIIGDMNWVGGFCFERIHLSIQKWNEFHHPTSLTNLEPSLGSRAMQCGTRLVVRLGQRLPVVRVLSKVAHKHLGSLRGKYCICDATSRVFLYVSVISIVRIVMNTTKRLIQVIIIA